MKTIGLFPLDYKLIEDITLLVGDLIVVPFRKQTITGIVWQINCSASDKKLKTIDLSLSFFVKNFQCLNLVSSSLYCLDNYYIPK